MRDTDDDFGPQFREPKTSNKTCLVLSIVFGVIGGGFLLCGGACLLGGNWVAGEITGSVRESLAENPVIDEHIGDVQSFEMEKLATLDHEDEDVFIFRVEGSKGSGTITATCLTGDDGGHQAYSGELVMDSGDRFDLFPDGVNPNFDGLAMDFDDDGFDIVTDQVRADIADHPVIVDRIGEIQEFVYDEDKSADEEGENVFVYRVRGARGAGVLRAESVTISADEEDVVSGELILDSGEKIQLFPEKPLN